MTKTGFVHIVGAGPGDPELLSLKAARLLKTADLVAYDDLVSPEVLALANPMAELLAIGYRGIIRQGAAPPPLHPQVLAAAQRGLQVVRLKSGDPMILGRTADEIQGLRAHGIGFAICPGITAALGAAAYAGIPLTQRGMAAGFSIEAAHRAPEAAAAEATTLVLYMARKHLQIYCQSLMQAGKDPSLPAAFVISASTPAQRVLVGTLATIADQVRACTSMGPGLAIIGPTVALRQELRWYLEKAPLAGLRVLLARARPGDSQLALALRQYGAEVSERPLIRAQPIINTCDIMDSAIQNILRAPDAGVVFACREGVESFFARLRTLQIDLRALHRLALLAIGKQADCALQALGLQAAARAPGHCQEALATLQPFCSGRRLLLVGSDRPRPSLDRDLHALGAHCQRLAVYHLHAQHLVWSEAPPDLIIAPSSSAIELLAAGAPHSDWLQQPILAIGPRTAAAARGLGATAVYQSPTDTLSDVISETAKILQRSSRATKSTDSQENKTW